MKAKRWYLLSAISPAAHVSAAGITEPGIIFAAMDRFCFVLTCLCVSLLLRAQCPVSINSFPYNEGFETSNGNWTPGGTASDWSWGTPIKPVINSAASGSKCWITGTLTQSFYSNNQNSTLTSPCFNFTGLANPTIRFRVFWETENRYDGAAFDYSIDGGTTWQVLGNGSTAGTCPQYSWYNTNSITTLGSAGWSGNIQSSSPCPGGAGNGSGGWRLAQFDLANLAGLPNVRFRFRFAAGSVCNDYDGFAVDDIFIGNQAPADGSISFSCGTGTTLRFASSWNTCGAVYNWNFGDPASGTANSATGAGPSHSFSAPGTYMVTVTYSGPSPLPPPATLQVQVIGVSASAVDGIDCKGDSSGTALAVVVPAGNYQYRWNTVPVQTTAFAGNLRAGTYQVQVTAPNACPATRTITLTEPDSLKHRLTVTDPRCGFPTGAAQVTASGGTAPYAYTWSAPTASGPTATSLSAGSYQVLISDNNNCTDTARFVLVDQNNLRISLGRDTLACLTAPLVLSPGSFASYLWQDNSTAPTLTVSRTGDYSVQVTDADGCTARDTVRIMVDCSDIYFPSAFTPNGDGLNDAFGAFGNTGLVRAYRLRVYDRWGGLIFQTSNPAVRWNGATGNGGGTTTTFVWTAEYEYGGGTGVRKQKGTITRIR